MTVVKCSFSPFRIAVSFTNIPKSAHLLPLLHTPVAKANPSFVCGLLSGDSFTKFSLLTMVENGHSVELSTARKLTTHSLTTRRTMQVSLPSPSHPDVVYLVCIPLCPAVMPPNGLVPDQLGIAKPQKESFLKLSFIQCVHALNRKAAFNNIRYHCPVLSTILIIYRESTELFMECACLSQWKKQCEVTRLQCHCMLLATTLLIKRVGD